MAKKECVAVVLAGGQGSRLNSLTKNLAKPAIPFGGRYRIIDFTLSNCYNSAIDTVGILTQYQPFTLHSHVGGGKAPELTGRDGGVFILPPYLRDDGGEWYKGTANAVYQNIDFVEQFQPERLLVLSGDHIYKMDYRLLLQYHQEKKADVTIAVIEVPWQEAYRFGIMKVDADSRICQFTEKPKDPPSNLASMGIYIFNWPLAKQYLTADDQNGKSSHDFGKDVIPRMLQEGCRMFAYPFDGYWMDVGTVDSLWQANMDLLREKPPLDLHDPDWPIYSVDPVQPPHYISGAAVARQALISDGCRVYGQVQHSVLFPGVQIGHGSIVEDSVVMPDVTIGDNVKIYGAIIGSGAKVTDNCKIGRQGAPRVTVIAHDLAVANSTGAEECIYTGGQEEML